MKRRFIQILLLFLLCEYGISFSQKEDSTNVPDSTNQDFINEVKSFSKKNNIVSKALRQILIFGDEKPHDAYRSETRVETFSRYQGKVIRNINIRVIDIFGPTVYHPDKNAGSIVANAGNFIHVDTRSWIVDNHLFFSQGDRLNPQKLAESERLLRSSDYIYDARIRVKAINNVKDSVDVDVIVQDIWSITGRASYHPQTDAGRVHFRDINFLGLGNEFSGGLNVDNRLPEGWNWDGSYLVKNIRGTFLDARLFHKGIGNEEQYGGEVSRNFFSRFIKYGGGVDVHWVKDYKLQLFDSTRMQNAAYNVRDVWLGYAANIVPYSLRIRGPLRGYFAARVIRTSYTRKPPLDPLNQFEDYYFYLSSLGFGFRQFYQDRYIFRLGKTEDIPVGGLAAITFGYKDGMYGHRPYYGFQAGLSSFNRKRGYLRGNLKLGSFRENGQWMDGILDFELLYFTKLYSISEVNIRHYLGSRYSRIYNSKTGANLLNIKNQNGLRGFRDGLEKGDQKLVFNYETNIFLPLRIIGFRFAVITFADLALLAPPGKSLQSQKLYQGVGIGLRIKNEHLIFNSIQLMMGYYPNAPENGEGRFYFFSQSSLFYHLNEFQFSRPAVVGF